MWKLLVALTILSFAAASIEINDEINDEINSELSLLFAEEAPFLYQEPDWWTRYGGGDIRRCQRRETAPYEGEECSRNPKQCFFGNQTCADGLDHPALSCACSGGIGMQLGSWKCAPHNCATCPSENPSALEEPQACVGDMKCHYEEEKCCGKAHPKDQCNCVGGFFECKPVDACMLPECFFADFHYLVGEACDFATATILDTYPGMEVSCATSPIEDDFSKNRIVIVIDDLGLVVNPPKLG